MHDISGLRKEYKLKTLDESDVAPHPVKQFAAWWKEAEESNIEEMNAMCLSTVNAQNQPCSRIVLLKGFNEDGFTFYSNYNSDKGLEMAGNSHIALLFFWKELERQVRICGQVHQQNREESDAYFNSRPRASQLGAWASPQSAEIAGRNVLEANEQKVAKQFDGVPVPRPEHWGGYTVRPSSIEFWQGRPSRLHDRIKYSLIENEWIISRLAP